MTAETPAQMLARIRSFRTQPTVVLHGWLRELLDAPEPTTELELDLHTAAMVLIRSELALRETQSILEKRFH